MEQRHHDFVIATTDGTVKDLDGSTYKPATSYNSRETATVGRRMTAQFEPFGLGRFQFTVPKGMAATVEVIAGGDATASMRPADTPGGWLDLQALEDFQASCEEDTTFIVVASSTQERTTFALEVTDVGETDCEATGEAAPSTAHCLVGEWKLVLGPTFIRQKVPLEFSPAQQAAMEFAGAKGDVILDVNGDGSFELAIDEFDETIAFRDYTVVTKSNGSGTGTRKAEGDTLGVALTGRKFTTVVEGSIAGLSSKPVNAPPTYTYLWSDGKYSCTDERFSFTFPDGMTVGYVRR